jgi:hypothetical protein
MTTNPSTQTGQPRKRLLSLGAGVQSTTLLMLAAEGRIGPLDGAIFADTGWEPAAVYEHLDRLEREIAQPAGIPIHRVSVGNIRNDALDPAHRFASMPLYVYGLPKTVRDPLETADCDCQWVGLDEDDLVENGGTLPAPAPCLKCGNTGTVVTRWGEPRVERSLGMIRRQCTSEYKLKPIKRKVRELLGAPHPTPVPKGVFVETWIGISVDEIDRAKDSDVGYMRNAFPLLDLGWRRTDCERYLRRNGFGATPKSACIGCPFHGNRQWREMRDEHPEEFADAVAFDAAIRAGNARANEDGSPLLGEAFLHRSRLPLDQAPIDRVTSHEWRSRQTDIFDAIADAEDEEGDPDGCSPWTCRSGAPAVVAA